MKSRVSGVDSQSILNFRSVFWPVKTEDFKADRAGSAISVDLKKCMVSVNFEVFLLGSILILCFWYVYFVSHDNTK